MQCGEMKLEEGVGARLEVVGWILSLQPPLSVTPALVVRASGSVSLAPPCAPKSEGNRKFLTAQFCFEST